MHRIIHHLRANAVAYLALTIALGGTSYAAVAIPNNSVGAAQLKNHSITPVKFNAGTIAGSVRAWAIVKADGSLVASAGKPVVITGPSTPGSYDIRWGVKLPKVCATVASVDFRSPGPTETVSVAGGIENLVAGYVSQVGTQNYSSGSVTRSVTGLETLNQSGQPTPLAFDVVVTC